MSSGAHRALLTKGEGVWAGGPGTGGVGDVVHVGAGHE
jgi:hypothetical protein